MPFSCLPKLYPTLFRGTNYKETYTFLYELFGHERRYLGSLATPTTGRGGEVIGLVLIYKSYVGHCRVWERGAWNKQSLLIQYSQPTHE